LGWSVVPALHLKNKTGLHAEFVRDENGQILLHPTRLLYYDYIRQFDAYAAFLSYVGTYSAEQLRQGVWQWNVEDGADLIFHVSPKERDS
jgi:hypothetical protein